MQRLLGQLQDLIGVWEKNFADLEDAEMLLDMAKEENDEDTYQEVVAGSGQPAPAHRPGGVGVHVQR